MPKPKLFIYEKKAPFRDAFLFIIVCEGTKREPEYFRFFDGMSSRVKVIPVISEIGSAPRLLIDTAIAKEEELEANGERDRNCISEFKENIPRNRLFSRARLYSIMGARRRITSFN